MGTLSVRLLVRSPPLPSFLLCPARVLLMLRSIFRVGSFGVLATCVSLVVAAGSSPLGDEVEKEKKADATKSTATIRVIANVDGEQGPGDGKKDGDRAEKDSAPKKSDATFTSGQITIEINGAKHSFSLNEASNDLDRTFKKIIRDGEKSIAVIGGSIESLNLDPQAMKKVLEEATESVQETVDLSDLLSDLPKEVRQHVQQLTEEMPDGESIKSAIAIGFDEVDLGELDLSQIGIGDLKSLPKIHVEGINVGGVEGLSKEMKRQVEAAMKKLSDGDKLGGPSTGKASVRVFRMKDGKMHLLHQEDSDLGAREESKEEPEGGADLSALSRKMDLILEQLGRLQNDVDALKAAK